MSNSVRLYLADAAATQAAGAALAAALSGGEVIFLTGDLGAGKTCLTGGLLAALGHGGPVKSPTYTLVEPYQVATHTVYHFDLYRLGHPQELDYMGIRDYFDERAVSLIEWPSRGQGYLPNPTLTIELNEAAPGRALLASAAPGGEQLLAALARLQL